MSCNQTEEENGGHFEFPGVRQSGTLRTPFLPPFRPETRKKKMYLETCPAFESV